MGLLKSYWQKYRLQCVMAPLFKMLEACFDLLVPLVVASIVDKGIAAGDRSYIISRFGLLVFMSLLGFCCSLVAQFFSAKAATGTAYGLRKAMLYKIQSLSLSQQEMLGSGRLLNFMNGDVNQLQSGINMFLRLFLRSPFIVFGALFMAWRIHKQLSLVFAGVILLLFVLVFGILYISTPRNKQRQQELDKVSSLTGENVSGVRVIRAFSREPIEEQRLQKQNKALEKAQMRVSYSSSWLNPISTLLIHSATLLILYVGNQQLQGGLLLKGDLVALIQYLGQILVELVKLANLIVLLSKAAAALDRLNTLMELPVEAPTGAVKQGVEGADRVVFEDVSLCYKEGSAPALSHISFRWKQGESIGIIGGTGSGKSSLVQLLLGLYKHTEGKILIDGVETDQWDQDALHKKLAMVEQKPKLFSGTVRSNLLWGREDAVDEALWAALEQSQGAEFVKKLPLGLDAPVEEQGRNFSGGQKQRLSIARALVRGADILILDDASSALDYATDAALRKALAALPQSTTKIYISQRVGSLKHCDTILVLDNGRLVGQGKHEALLKSCQVYREIYESQFEGGEGA